MPFESFYSQNELDSGFRQPTCFFRCPLQRRRAQIYVLQVTETGIQQVSDLVQWQVTKTLFNKQARRILVYFSLIRQCDLTQKCNKVNFSIWCRPMKISCSCDWTLRHNISLSLCFSYCSQSLLMVSVQLASYLFSPFPPVSRSMSVSRSCWLWRSSWREAL